MSPSEDVRTNKILCGMDHLLSLFQIKHHFKEADIYRKVILHGLRTHVIMGFHLSA